MNGRYNKGDRVVLVKPIPSDKAFGLDAGMKGTVMDNHTTYPDVMFDGKTQAATMGEWQLELISK